MNNIRLEISESIATLTIDRPTVRNALNLETVNECHHAEEPTLTRSFGPGYTAYCATVNRWVPHLAPRSDQDR